MGKTAVISGCKSQDGSLLAEYLLDKGYRVIGLERHASSPDYSNIKLLFANTNFILEQADINDSSSLNRIAKEYSPDEWYNFAAQSSPADSWDQPVSTLETNFVGVCNSLEAIRLLSPKTKFFQASTSEVYGNPVANFQDENSPTNPRNPYGVSKLSAESLVKMYRDKYGIFACFARSFNHQSSRLSKSFVARKITSSIGEMVSRINESSDFLEDRQTTFECALSDGVILPIHLGNLDSVRDFSNARDIVRGAYLMLQNFEPCDYVLGSGIVHSVRDSLDAAFGFVGVTNWADLVVIDPKFYREKERFNLCADYSKASKELKWMPEFGFKETIREMVMADCGKQELHILEKAK